MSDYQLTCALGQAWLMVSVVIAASTPPTTSTWTWIFVSIFAGIAWASISAIQWEEEAHKRK